MQQGKYVFLIELFARLFTAQNDGHLDLIQVAIFLTVAFGRVLIIMETSSLAGDWHADSHEFLSGTI